MTSPLLLTKKNWLCHESDPRDTFYFNKENLNFYMSLLTEKLIKYKIKIERNIEIESLLSVTHETLKRHKVFSKFFTSYTV